MLFVFVVELEEFFIHSGYKSLIKVGLANIFSRPVHYIRIMYSDTEKFLIFIKSDLSTFSSAGPALGVISKDPCQIRGPEDLTRCFLQACYTFVFILNPLEHFELTFVYGMRLGSHFFFFFFAFKNRIVLAPFPAEAVPFPTEWVWCSVESQWAADYELTRGPPLFFASLSVRPSLGRDHTVLSAAGR